MYRFFILYFLLSSSSIVSANAINGWPNGTASYKKIHTAASKDQRPLLVYFYTDWCSYCKRLNREYIKSALFQELSGGLYKVQINPEKSRKAERLFKVKYQGTGYPTVIVSIPGLSKQFRKYHPFSRQGDMTPGEYVNQIRGAIAGEYNRHAYSLFEKKQYKTAREYLYKSLTYDVNNKYALTLVGITYHQQGYEKRDRVLMKKAREVYEKALSIYPGDTEILKNLSLLDS